MVIDLQRLRLSGSGPTGISLLFDGCCELDSSALQQCRRTSVSLSVSLSGDARGEARGPSGRPPSFCRRAVETVHLPGVPARVFFFLKGLDGDIFIYRNKATTYGGGRKSSGGRDVETYAFDSRDSAIADIFSSNASKRNRYINSRFDMIPRWPQKC